METATYQSILEHFCELSGREPTQLQALDKSSFNRLFNVWARRGWNWYFWFELMLTQERRYRDTWASATTYAAAAEVWFDNSTVTGYFSANASPNTPVAGESPASAPTKWTELTAIDAYVGLDQAGATPIGTVKTCWWDNPRSASNARRVPVPFRLDERGITLVGDSIPSSVFVEFRKRCPSWTGADYSASATYVSGATRFYSSATAGYEGDYWTTTATTVAGENPETAAAKWSKLEIPRVLAAFIAHGAYTSALRGEDQNSKGLAEESPAWSYLYDEQDRLEAQSGQYRRAKYAAGS